jgi:hypothetical protein
MALIALSLSCGWGAREAHVPPADPTQAPQPTFTPTPLPPTSTTVPTRDPALPTDTPLPTNTPLPSDTPVPATDTPTASPVPSNTPAPPTSTPVPPTPTPIPPSPTFTSVPVATSTPTFNFQLSSWWKENNCYDLGVYGVVLDTDDDPLDDITIEVVGDEDTFTETTDSDGRYDIHLGSLLDYPDGATWYVRLKDGGQIVSDQLEWNTSQDCSDDDEIQILRLEWKRRP